MRDLRQESSSITIEEARNILGTTAKELSDESISRLIIQVDMLSAVVIDNFDDSKIHNLIDIPTPEVHNVR